MRTVVQAGLLCAAVALFGTPIFVGLLLTQKVREDSRYHVAEKGRQL